MNDIKTPFQYMRDGKFISNEPFSLDCDEYDTTSSAIVDANGKVVCIVPEAHSGDWDDNERRSTLSGVVKAVNYHDRLVGALRDFSELDRMSMENAAGFIEDNCRDLRELIKELEDQK